jgi:mono/diheme cytochrome c family protein
MRILSLLCGLGLVLAGCSVSGQRAGGFTLPDARSDGARAFASRCGTCHALPHPRRHDYAAWQALVGLMDRRMAERGVAPLTDSERTAILAYLRENCR